jgi:hypothetical protein
LEKPDELEYYDSTFYLQSETYPEFIAREIDPTYDHIPFYGGIQEYIKVKKE